MSSSSPYTDLSGIFYIQQQYLLDLSAVSYGGSINSKVATELDTLRTKLANVYSAYSGASPTTDSILTKQQDMYNIINAEQARLSQKKQSVDSALYGQKRMAKFSDSYSKKYFAQIKVLIVIIVVVLIYLGLTFLNSIIPVPDGIFITIMVIVGVFAFVVALMTIKDISSRYNMDFDKIDYTAPSRSSLLTGNIDGNVDIGNVIIGCVGESCCPDSNSGVHWDESLSQCVKNGFTLMSEAYPAQTLNITGQVKPYEPSEINSYTAL